MKSKILGALVGAFLALPAYASPTFVSATQGSVGTNTATVTLPEACQPKDLLVVSFTPQSGVSPAPTWSISASPSEGTWNAPAGLQVYDSSSQLTIASFWVACNATATPAITLSGFSGQGYITVVHYNGFVNGPVYVSADAVLNPAGGSTSNSGTAAAITPLTNSQTNELVIADMGAFPAAGNISATGSFTQRAGATGGGGIALGDVFETTSGNSLTWSATIGSTNWAAMTFGFTDTAAGSGCTHTAYTSSGGKSIPTAGSTSVWLKSTGTFGTTPCDGTGSSWYSLPTGTWQTQ